MHDVLDPRDLVPDEAEQRATSGHHVGELAALARAAADQDDLEALARIELNLAELERDGDWPYFEPTDEQEILDGLRDVERLPVDPGGLGDRFRGAWLGRAVGNTLGKPIEGLTRVQVKAYLHAAGQWPQTGYLPLLDPLPAGVPRLHPSASIATAGRFTDVPRDDDLDWTILNLWLLERHGRGVSTEQVLAGWLDRIPFTQTYTAERAAYRNAIAGIRPPETATHRNPYREWIGALIRGDAFGYVSPGDPAAAARLALVDARLSHVANGLYGELWAAGLVALALATDDVATAVRRSIAVIPQRSRLAEVLHEVVRMRETGVTHVGALDWVDGALGHYSWVHTLNNAALIAIALLWGGTFMEAAAIAIEGGRDTDSTTATVGSVYGAVHGAAAVPAALVGTTHVHVRSAVRDFDRITIDELAERTLDIVTTEVKRGAGTPTG